MSAPLQTAINKELELAAQVQAGLLPKTMCCLSDWQIAFSYEAAHFVSGDYVDLIESSADAFYFLLGDVAGKGVAAALLMAHLHATVRGLLASELPLTEVVRKTSSLFCQSSLPAQFVTLVLGRATRNGGVEVVNAGHTPVLVLRDSEIARLSSTGVPLGMFCEIDSASVAPAHHVQASPNDMFFLCSDGVTETIGDDGSEYGSCLERTLAGTLTRDPRAVIATVRKDLEVFSVAPLADDRTLLALTFAPGIRTT